MSSDEIRERMKEGGEEARQREEAGGREEGYSSCDSGEEGESGEEREVVRVEVGKPEWDCESILRCVCSLLPLLPRGLIDICMIVVIHHYVEGKQFM